MSDPINYNHLRYFFEVARQGSIVAASRSMRVSPPTISTQVRALEDVLGVKLFAREGRGLVLTREGRIAREYAADIFRLAGEMRRSLESDAEAPLSLRVGASDGIPKWLVSWILQPALAQRPRVRLELSESPPDVLYGRLINHELDLVLTDRPGRKDGALHSRTIVTSPSVLYAHRELAEDLQERLVAGESACPIVLPDPDSALHARIEHWFADRDLAIEVVAEVHDSALAKIVASECGAAYVGPRLIAPALEAHLDLVPVFALDGLEEVVQATVPRREAHPVVEQLLTSAAERLATQPVTPPQR